jgi:hypothetical protein
MLLSAFGQRRPRRDIDPLAKATSDEPAAVATLVREIAVVETDDDVAYDTSQMTTRVIREQDLYAAVRVAVPGRHPPAGTTAAAVRCRYGGAVFSYHDLAEE